MKFTRKHNSNVRRITAACAFIAASLVSLSAQTPLPGDIVIKPPSSAVAPDLAAFSGTWLGAWGGELPTALVVEQVNSNGAVRLIYSWGDAPAFHVESDFSRERGQISHGKLKVLWNSRPQVDFTMMPGGILFGKYSIATNAPPSFVALHRLPSTNASEISDAAKKEKGGWQEVRIPLQSLVGPTKGKNLALQTTIYHQPVAGKHPVVIVNHGSTGPGIIPVSDVYRGGSEEAFYCSRGYVVVVPMRKGRGASDGPHLEEDNSLTPAVQLDSAIEDLQAVVKYLKRQPDVDAGKIVLSGASRGGLLSVAYAGRHPEGVVGVINFSGGWFSEDMSESVFNGEAFAKAGGGAKVPMLWLYADNDSLYGLKHIEKNFAKFREAGGRGELVEVRNLPGEGHMLAFWADRWQDKVNGYLKETLIRRH